MARSGLRRTARDCRLRLSRGWHGPATGPRDQPSSQHPRGHLQPAWLVPRSCHAGLCHACATLATQALASVSNLPADLRAVCTALLDVQTRLPGSVASWRRRMSRYTRFEIANDASRPSGFRLENPDGFATALREHGFALLCLGGADARETLHHYKAQVNAFFEASVVDKLATAERLSRSGVASTYLPAGDLAARALASRREMFALTVRPDTHHDTDESRLLRYSAVAMPEPEPEPEPQAPVLPCFGDAAEAMARLCQALAEELLTELALAMGVPPSLFRPEATHPAACGAPEQTHQAQHPPHSLTAFHYLGADPHECPADEAADQVMLAAHYDMNLLTIQVPSASPGLEVLDVDATVAGAAADGHTSVPVHATPSAEGAGGPAARNRTADQAHAHHGWISLEALNESPPLGIDLIAFGGAPLHRLTAGYYPACSHRVVAAPGQSTRVSSVYKHKVADGAILRTQAVIDAARAAGHVAMLNWASRAAAVLRPSAGAGHPFLLLEPLERGKQIDDAELRQLEVAAALHNLVEMRPELMPRGDSEAEPEADLERKHFPLHREPGEKLGASVAADGTILGYTGSDSAAARARLPKGWQIVAVDHAEVACLEQLKQRLSECSPGAAVVLTCAPRRAAAA